MTRRIPRSSRSRRRLRPPTRTPSAPSTASTTRCAGTAPSGRPRPSGSRRSLPPWVPDWPSPTRSARGGGTTATTSPARSGPRGPLRSSSSASPATPYQWAQALASQLDSARLVTVEGHGHGAYGRKGECVDNAVDRYLLRGELPDSDLTCTEEVEQVGA
ncbi:alpha/beta hydrolase [Actinomyces howellii]|uniref:alpha/beta hydrolase n=1 Tax=Actinomyces howellii TaxID=52771 RepID=UPI002F9420F3